MAPRTKQRAICVNIMMSLLSTKNRQKFFEMIEI